MNRRTLIILTALLVAVCAGVVVFVVQNRKIVISLDENPTTGYRWEYILSNDSVELVSDNYEPSKTASGIVGAGGIRTFVFRKTGKEGCTIDFYYRRSWEEFPNSPDYTHVVK